MSEDETVRRIDLARETARRIFDRDFTFEAQDGEPARAAGLREQMFAQAYADSWSREAIPPEVKSLVTVAMLAALGNFEEMKTHVAAGIHLGNTADQYVDLFAHVAAYCGTSRAVPGWNAASEVIRKVALSRARRQERPE